VENVPVIIVNGSPTREQFLRLEHSKILSHHTIDQGRRSQIDIFRPITVSAHIIDVAAQGPFQIDEALRACLIYQQPVYLEVCVELWHQQCFADPSKPLGVRAIPSLVNNVNSAVEFACQRLKSAKHPLIWAGAEIRVLGAQDTFDKFLGQTTAQYVTSLDAKGIVNERAEKFVGILDAGFTTGQVDDALQACDFLLVLGVWFEDLRGFSAIAEKAQSWMRVFQRGVHTSEVSGRTLYEEVSLSDFIHGLLNKLKLELPDCIKVSPLVAVEAEDTTDSSNTYDSFPVILQKSSLWKEKPMILVDVTLALYSVASLPVQRDQWVNEFIWGSIGWTCGAGVGAKCAKPNDRVILITGDGGLQNHPIGLSAMAQLKQNTIVFVFVNNTYAIDQYLVNPKSFNLTDPEPFEHCNVIHKWDYVKLAQAFGGHGFAADNHEQLLNAINEACKVEGTFALIEVRISQHDLPSSLRKLS
jgi:indolepyruvate decarboxylase